jgi:hypothetical protein
MAEDKVSQAFSVPGQYATRIEHQNEFFIKALQQAKRVLL